MYFFHSYLFHHVTFYFVTFVLLLFLSISQWHHLSHSCEWDFAGMPWENLFRFGTKTQLDSRMNWFELTSHIELAKYIFGHNSTFHTDVYRNKVTTFIIILYNIIFQMLKVNFEKHQFRFIQCRALGAVQDFIPAVSSYELCTFSFSLFMWCVNQHLTVLLMAAKFPLATQSYKAWVRRMIEKAHRLKTTPECTLMGEFHSMSSGDHLGFKSFSSINLLMQKKCWTGIMEIM